MRVWMIHFFGALGLVCFLSLLPECTPAEAYQAKVINASIYPLISIKIAPFCEDEEIQRQFLKNACNLLPADRSGHTVALQPGLTQSFNFKSESAVLAAAVTFFIDGDYVEYVHRLPADMSVAHDSTMLVVRVIYDTVNAPYILFSYE